jgi:hypothetical protein
MADERPPHRDLVDQSLLRKKRALRRIGESQERIDRTHHNWHAIALGRICDVCLLTQATGEFEDESACEAS